MSAPPQHNHKTDPPIQPEKSVELLSREGHFHHLLLPPEDMSSASRKFSYASVKEQAGKCLDLSTQG